MTLEGRLRELLANGGMDLPFPGEGQTGLRHRQLIDIAREDLALARLAEAHTDALVTVRAPEHYLVDVDLRAHPDTLTFDENGWKVSAFIGTQTATTTFLHTPVAQSDVIGNPDWYLQRPGFWHGACGPAACWAGGAIGLVDYARSQDRADAHTMAHLGAMHAAAWALRAFLDSAGNEIDRNPQDACSAQARALTVRHLVEQACSEVLRRLGRAYGPRALAYDAEVSRRYQELDLYIRQSHAERDLEVLGRHVAQGGGK
jgi:alkylation response protein AidB-like acyl-CoA dehydrogenase